MNSAEIQKWIFEKLIGVQTSGLTREQKDDLAFWLGIAWGETLVHALNWEWVMLEAADNPEMQAIAVASPSRSYAVPVMQFLEKLATGAQADQTSELLFNMIVAGTLPPAKADELKLLA